MIQPNGQNILLCKKIEVYINIKRTCKVAQGCHPGVLLTVTILGLYTKHSFICVKIFLLKTSQHLIISFSHMFRGKKVYGNIFIDFKLYC